MPKVPAFSGLDRRGLLDWCHAFAIDRIASPSNSVSKELSIKWSVVSVRNEIHRQCSSGWCMLTQSHVLRDQRQVCDELKILTQHPLRQGSSFHPY